MRESSAMHLLRVLNCRVLYCRVLYCRVLYWSAQWDGSSSAVLHALCLPGV